ncbi:uncharacterized protein B0T23DRAFT_308298 [Neurospora hispaniola]|uniref:Uncharacterized protein n=1 Tax=Neurospora hispaniola TaxID=588809 RepID=A0AAJ0IHA6_9PEZI|nr:hypothetical protein B0T23DRAFT_308298 [Neurospora hispaniola]
MAPTKPTAGKRRYVPHVFDMGSLLAALKSSDLDEHQSEAKGKVKSPKAKTLRVPASSRPLGTRGRKLQKPSEAFGLPSDSKPRSVAASRQLESFLKQQKGGPWKKTAGVCKVASKKSEGRKRRERERKQRRKAEKAAKSASA